MNWTEGSLNRHSRARKGKETLLRQKEHFAKARAGLLDANVKISPPSVSVLAVPARPPSVHRGALKSTSSRNHQSDDRLISSRYFSGSHPKLPRPTRLPEEDTEEAMRQKRRKLLLKGDWVGTNVQKPIEMKFTKPRGSPTNPWGAKKSRRQASRHKLRQLVGLVRDEGHNRARMRAADTFTPTSLRQIKVRVGSCERALGDISNASPRNNGLAVGLSGSLGQPKYHRLRANHQDRGQASVSRSDASHRSHSSASQTPLLTTSPLLFHPVPTRPALLQLLHRESADSDNAGSTFAQVGGERPAVPPSQAEDNDVWRDFVAGPDEISALKEMRTSDDLGDAAQRLVSPEVSQLETSRSGFDLAQPSESPRSNDEHDEKSIKEQNRTAGSSDEVSLLVISSSPKLPPSASFQMDQPGDISIGCNVLSPHVDVHQLEREDSAPRDGPSTAVEEQLPSACIQEDDNDMWRNFVFGDSSENLEKALEEARRDTVRSIRPALPSTSTYSCEESQQGLTTSSLGDESTDRRDFAKEFCNPTRDVFTTASASHVATAGTSSTELSSEATSGSIETAVRTDRATRGSSGSSSANFDNPSRLLFPNDLVASSICEADTGASNINPEQLEKHGEADDCFKFARPKLFVGKKIGHVDEQRQIALSAPQIRGTTQTRRRPRRAADGRANIRKLPNYGSDPIEEFEADIRSDRAEKGSMFGSLETEKGV